MFLWNDAAKNIRIENQKRENKKSFATFTGNEGGETFAVGSI